MLCDAVCDLLCFVIPAQRSASGKLRSRIIFALFRKHKFQVDLMVRIVLYKYSVFGTFRKKVIEVLTDLYDLIYRIFQLCFPRKSLTVHIPLPVAHAFGLFGVLNHKKMMPLAHIVRDVHELLK